LAKIQKDKEKERERRKKEELSLNLQELYIQGVNEKAKKENLEKEAKERKKRN
jgi:hypothetical protein